MSTRHAAEAELPRLARLVHEADEGAAVARLLERISGADDPDLLRAALAEAGAAAVLQAVRDPEACWLALEAVARDMGRR